MDRPAQVKVCQRHMVQGGKKSHYRTTGHQTHHHQVAPRSVNIRTSRYQQNNAISRARLLVAENEARHNGVRQGLRRVPMPQGQQPAYMSGVNVTLL